MLYTLLLLLLLLLSLLKEVLRRRLKIFFNAIIMMMMMTMMMMMITVIINVFMIYFCIEEGLFDMFGENLASLAYCISILLRLSFCFEETSACFCGLFDNICQQGKDLVRMFLQ